MKDITIQPALNGWKVKVGCQEVLFTNRKTMFSEISRYINDPDKVEAEYIKKAKNKVQRGQIATGSVNTWGSIEVDGLAFRSGCLSGLTETET